MTLRNISFWSAAFRNKPFVKEAVRRLRTKEDGGLHSGILQNPSDPDATFREKAGKEHRGMLPIWKRQSVKTALSSRIISTSKTTTATAGFWKTAWDARKYRKKKRSLLQTVLIQEKQTMILPKKRTSVWLIPIYTGKPVDDILADFVFNETGTKVLRCPAGYEPKSCGYTGSKSQQFHISFKREQCAGCPNKDRCKAKIHKRVSSVTVSVKAHERAKQQRYMGTEEFHNLLKIRNGVENSTLHFEKNLPYWQDASQRTDKRKIFLWLQNRGIEL